MVSASTKLEVDRPLYSLARDNLLINQIQVNLI